MGSPGRSGGFEAFTGSDDVTADAARRAVGDIVPRVLPRLYDITLIVLPAFLVFTYILSYRIFFMKK